MFLKNKSKINHLKIWIALNWQRKKLRYNILKRLNMNLNCKFYKLQETLVSEKQSIMSKKKLFNLRSNNRVKKFFYLKNLNWLQRIINKQIMKYIKKWWRKYLLNQQKNKIRLSLMIKMLNQKSLSQSKILWLSMKFLTLLKKLRN